MSHSYVIVGSGVFGLSTALDLSTQNPQCSITIIDRYEPPVPDGSSVDSSRIVRADYSDPVYASLAAQAREIWKSDPELKDIYHECGMLLNTASSPEECTYLDKSIDIVKSLNIDVETVSVDGVMHKIYGKDLPDHLKGLGLRGYLNPLSGYADARKGIEVLYERAKLRRNINFIFESVECLHYTDESRSAAAGVKLISGGLITGDTVILATGAWQLPDVPVPTVASGQVLAYIDLSPEEVQKFRNMPIIINFSTGWFCIGPYQNQLKIARHAEGYLNTCQVTNQFGECARNISIPMTSMTEGRNQEIPKEGENALREGLRLYLPEFADRLFVNSRVCWYSDTPKADFLIDWYSETKNLFICAGGSGHAYKMLPILGRLIVSVLTGEADDTLKAKWSFESAYKAQKEGITLDGSRGKGGPLEWNEIA